MAPNLATDDLGRTIVLPDTIHRVVTLAPNLTELVFTAGAGSRLVGVTTADDFPPAVERLPKISALPLDFEALAALNPDLVLATDQVNSPDMADTFAALNIPIYFFSYNDVEGLLRSLHTTGDLLDTPTRAAAAADSLQDALDALGERTAEMDKPLTLFLIGDDTLYSFGDESYIHDLIAIAGGRSATEDIGTNAPILSDEYVLTTKPEVIFGAFGENYDPAHLLEQHPTWDIVPAVANGRVYSLDPSLILRPGPRLVEGTRQMAMRLHPALFSSADTTATR
ncbi:MAG TPA: ABC transporter substrate-binding protein [Rhodothermales bacterium]|nr:ABC transporter substrate-binding protein [Rhodothermales bacterium]